MDEFNALDEKIMSGEYDDAECQELQRNNIGEENDEESYIGNRIVKQNNQDNSDEERKVGVLGDSKGSGEVKLEMLNGADVKDVENEDAEAVAVDKVH